MIERLYLSVILVLLLLASCRHGSRQAIKDYTYHPAGYYYHLAAFGDNSARPRKDDILWLDAAFKTLKDSVFWDSRHDASGKFLLKAGDSLSDPLALHLLKMNEGDSVCYYIRPKDFFRIYFNTDKIPFFSAKDSLVKADIRLRKILREPELEVLFKNFGSEESRVVEDYVAAAKSEAIYKDSSGVIWLEHKTTAGSMPHLGSICHLTYKGYFLDGKLIDNSNGSFAFTYGTPDQLLKGLNFVIKKMRKGEYAKIILPSYLAYGKNGSSNGAIPPFTPLLYEIQLTEVK